MNKWKTLIRVSQVKRNDAVRIGIIANPNKHWIYIVEKVTLNEIHLSGGENYPSFKIIYQEELEQGQYEFISLK